MATLRLKVLKFHFNTYQPRTYQIEGTILFKYYSSYAIYWLQSSLYSTLLFYFTCSIFPLIIYYLTTVYS